MSSVHVCSSLTPTSAVTDASSAVRNGSHLKDCKDLVKKLLVKNPNQRLGMGRAGATAVKSHAWFKGFDWSALVTRSMAPPFVPSVSLNAAVPGSRSYSAASCLSASSWWKQIVSLSVLMVSAVCCPAQLETEEDASYFDEVPDVDDSHPRKRYVSTGVFRDF